MKPNELGIVRIVAEGRPKAFAIVSTFCTSRSLREDNDCYAPATLPSIVVYSIMPGVLREHFAQAAKGPEGQVAWW